jgi:hypothetical protein
MSALPLRLSSLLLALSPSLVSAGEAGSLPAGSPYLRPALASPVTISQRFVVDGERLQAGGVALPLTAPEGALVVLVPRAGVVLDRAPELALVDAGGFRREAGKALSGVATPRAFDQPDLADFDLPSRAQVLELGRLPAGRYTLTGADDVAAVLVAEPNSQLVMRARATPLAVRSGELLVVETVLVAAGQPVRGATIRLRYSDAAGGHELLLAERSAGRYTTRIAPLAGEALSRLDLRLDASGDLADGTPFARTGLAGAMVTRAAADFDSAAVEWSGEGLRTEIAGASGRYRLEATFALAGAGSEPAAVAYSREDFTLADGRRVVTLAVPPAAAGADRVALRLLNVDTLGLERETELDLAVPGEPLTATVGADGDRQGLPVSKLRARQQFNEDP